jgi:hypothetical protein
MIGKPLRGPYTRPIWADTKDLLLQECMKSLEEFDSDSNRFTIPTYQARYDSVMKEQNYE